MAHVESSDGGDAAAPLNRAAFDALYRMLEARNPW